MIHIQFPQSVAVAHGETNTLPITISRFGFRGTVEFAVDVLPAGLSATFTPQRLTGADTTTTLSVTATKDAAVGNTSFAIRAAGAGVEPASEIVGVIVRLPGTFSLTLDPSILTIRQGDSAEIVVRVNRAGGFTGPVTLSTGSSLITRFSPVEVTGDMSVLTVRARSTQSVSGYSSTVIGTSPGRENAAVGYTVTVTQR